MKIVIIVFVLTLTSLISVTCLPVDQHSRGYAVPDIPFELTDNQMFARNFLRSERMLPGDAQKLSKKTSNHVLGK